MLATFLISGTPEQDEIFISVQNGLVLARVNSNEFNQPDSLVTAIVIDAGGGNDTIGVSNNTDNPVTLNAGPGDDQVHLGGTTSDMSGLTATLAVNGEAGTDRVWAYDQNHAAPSSYAVTASLVTRSGIEPVSHAGVEMLILAGGSGGNVVEIDSPNLAVSLGAGSGQDVVHVDETGPAGATTVLGSAGNDAITVNGDGIGTATAAVRVGRIGSLTIGAGGRAEVAGFPHTDAVVTGALNLGAGAVLDLGANDLVIDYTDASPLQATVAAILRGYAGGTWAGPGITSSLAAAESETGVGYAEASELFSSFPAPFAGTTIDATSVVVRYTHYGDADLNNRVDLSDFNRLAANFGRTGARWAHGDFDYDGTVNLADFNRLAGNFGGTSGPSTTGAATATRTPPRLVEELIESL